MCIRAVVSVCLCGIVYVITASASAEVTFDWTTIGHTNNPQDPLTGFGGLQHEYRLSKYEVTNLQYAEFLNAVAASDPHGLFNTNMEIDPVAGISRSGSSGSFSYTAMPGRENHPVVYVSFLDAMRFSNWLHNGQGAGDTETGAYSITDGTTETRLPGATFFLPSEEEWYKAAYHQPSNAGGDFDDYWLFPTQSNSTPIPGIDANYDHVLFDTTAVGQFASNFYGLHDLAGNVFEWNESLVPPPPGSQPGIRRGIRGGSWTSGGDFMLQSINYNGGFPFIEDSSIGFRVGSMIPSPTPMLCIITGFSVIACRRRSDHS